MHCSIRKKDGSFIAFGFARRARYTAPEDGKANGRIKISVYLGSNVETEIEVGQSTLIAADDDPVQGRILSDGSSIQITLDAGRKGCFLIFCYYLKRMAFLYNESIDPENHA